MYVPAFNALDLPLCAKLRHLVLVWFSCGSPECHLYQFNAKLCVTCINSIICVLSKIYSITFHLHIVKRSLTTTSINI